MTDSAKDFRNVQTALELLRAYETNIEVPVQQNPAFQQALRRFGTADTPQEIGVKLGQVAQGQVILNHILMEGLAQTTGTTIDQQLERYEAQTQALIAQLTQE